MIRRCYDPTHPGYARYGGAGILVCEQWREFPAFWLDMGERPKGRYSIGRIDNCKGYSPENCRWEDDYQQANNKSSNHFIEWQGRRQTIAQWARERGWPRAMLKDRIVRYGWSAERALTEPPRKWAPSRPLHSIA